MFLEGWKTSWDKDKMLFTSIFPFSHIVFYSFRNKIHFNPFPNKPLFFHVCSTSVLKTLWEKEKRLVKSNFSFSHSVFYQFVEPSTIFIKFENCCLQTPAVWNSLKFVVWKRVKSHIYFVICKVFQIGLV